MSGTRRDLRLLIILALAFGLRCYQLTAPAWDYHNWRQTVTLMVAREFTRNGFDVLHPRVSWVSHDSPSDPSYFSGEFSLESMLTAILYSPFGEHIVTARLVVIAFALLGIYWLYDLLKRRAGTLAAFLGALILSLLPFHIFFGRVFMPDIPAVSLATGGLTMLDRWTDTRKAGHLLTAAVLTALGILQKLTVVFILLPLAYLLWTAYGKRVFVCGSTYVFTIISVVPAVLWYVHAFHMGQSSGFAIMQPDLFGHGLRQWFSFSFVIGICKAVAGEAFSPVAFMLVIVGFCWPVNERLYRLFRFWVIGSVGLLLLMPNVLPQNHYYLTILLPGGAALAGLVLARLSYDRRAYPLIALLTAAVALSALQAVLPCYESDRIPYELGRFLNRTTTPGDLIITETGGSPHILYYADRRGWMLDGQFNMSVVERLVKAGARYYADPFAQHPEIHRQFFQELDARYERVSDEHSPWRLYRLR